MPAFERATIAVTALVVLLLFLVPPFMCVDASSGGRVHASLGYHPVWNPPTAEEAFRALYPDTAGTPAPARLADLTPRVNRVRLAASVAAAAALCAVVTLARRRLKRAPPSVG